MIAVKTRKRTLSIGTSAVRSLTASVCVLALLVLALATAFAIVPSHSSGPGLAWACLAAIFIFFSLVVVSPLRGGLETFSLPATGWIPSVSPRGPPFLA